MKEMGNVWVIGAGGIGSRHLQALKKVRIPLEITVIDPSAQSLNTAQERYESAPGGVANHKIEYLSKIPKKKNEKIDIAVVATCSDVRAAAIKELLKYNRVRYLVLEKILFSNKQDYGTIEKIIKKKGINAWVNCSMRMMPFYRRVSKELAGQTISYHVDGSKYGLITNAIHYLDHMAGIIGNTNFKLDASGLEKDIILSKRGRFLELNGTINVRFGNGSNGMFRCYSGGTAPVIIEIYGKNLRCISKESEGKVWLSRKSGNWKWGEYSALVPPQSRLTTELVESILNTGKCDLVTYSESKEIHLKMLKPLLAFVNKNRRKKVNKYPFT